MGKLVVKLVSEMDKDIHSIFNKNYDVNKNILYVDNEKQLASILSSGKFSLLLYIKRNNLSISEISKNLNRKQEAISRDAKILEDFGLIKKIKKGRKIFLKPKVNKIEIRF